MVELNSAGEQGWNESSIVNSSHSCKEGAVTQSSTSSTQSPTMLEIPANELTFKVRGMLEKLQKLAVKEEEQLYRLSLPAMSTDGCVGAAERDSAVSTIKSMQRFYNYGSNTLAASVSYMDRFLSKVKVKLRYLSCVAAASFYLSTKMHEETEHCPTASDLSSLNRRIWKASDLKRMEKVILDKLEWSLFPSINCLTFLYSMHELLQILNHSIEKSFFNLLVQRAELYINYSKCSSYKASTLALAIVHQCVKSLGMNSVPLNYILLHIQAVCKVSDCELWDCACTISHQLELSAGPWSRPRCLPLPKLIPRPNLVLRPSCYGGTDLPTIQEVPWIMESREEATMVSGCLLDSRTNAFMYGPCVIKRDIPTTQSLCFISDQCYFGPVGAYYNKCNIPV